MATYYKPQSPIQSGEDFIYPITTADQIMKSDKSRRLEQAGLIVADNSTSLGGVAAEDYALKTDTAPDSSKLSGKTLAEIMLTLYPVGSIYMSVSDTSPASLFGGTWEQIKGRFLLACGDNGDGWNYSPGSTGGEPAHTLTVNEMPSHTHVIYRNTGTDDNNFSGHIANRVAANDTSDENKQTVTSDATGGGGAHNNLPPYLAVYMWKRVS